MTITTLLFCIHRPTSSHIKPVFEYDSDVAMELQDKFEKFTSQELHEKLKKVDPVFAAKMHPNDKRKIMRFVSIVTVEMLII